MLFFFSVQNGAVTQKDTLNDDEFEPYLNTQARQVSFIDQCLPIGCNFKFNHVYYNVSMT